MKRKTITASQDDILVYWNQEFGSSYPLTKRLFQEKILDSKELVDDGSYSLYYQEEYIGSMVLKFNHSNDKKLQDHAYLAFLFVNPKF
nr:hypothetical protein [Bacilli bacterium]